MNISITIFILLYVYIIMSRNILHLVYFVFVFLCSPWFKRVSSSALIINFCTLIYYYYPSLISLSIFCEEWRKKGFLRKMYDSFQNVFVPTICFRKYFVFQRKKKILSPSIKNKIPLSKQTSLKYIQLLPPLYF